MKSKTLLWWAYVALAAASLYFFCTITCAPVRTNSIAHVSDNALILAFLFVVAYKSRDKVRNFFYNKQKIQ